MLGLFFFKPIGYTLSWFFSNWIYYYKEL